MHKQAASEVYLTVCPASAGTLHQQLSPCHQASPPPPDLGQTQNAETIPSSKCAAVTASDPVCPTSPQSTLLESLKTSLRPNLLTGGIFPKSLQWRGCGQIHGMPQCWWCSPSPAHPLYPGNGLASPLQWTRQNYVSVLPRRTEGQALKGNRGMKPG